MTAAARGMCFTLVVATAWTLALAPDAFAAQRMRVVAAAGDISPNDASGDDARVARMITSVIRPDAVLPLGDEQYPDGTKEQFLRFYVNGWGVPSINAISYPVPGNHEYDPGSGERGTDPAAGYFEYFRQRAAVNPNGVARRAGYYSFNLGSWHLVALNSRDGFLPAAKQQDWLRHDLKADPHSCELAYWHHPRWSSGNEHGSNSDMQPFWSIAVKAGVDVVLNGHEHLYERFQRKLAGGKPVPDGRSGIGAREFVVGTGGKGGNHGFGRPLPGSQARWPAHGSGDVFGALELDLHTRSYSWRMLNASGGVVDEGGPVRCHGDGS